MSNEIEFMILLTEQYAHYKGTDASRILKQWDDLCLTDKIAGMYEMYHSEAIENAFNDIERMMAESRRST